MSEWFSNLLSNTRAIGLALLVHAIIIALIGLNTDLFKTPKPVGAKPIQAVVIIEPEMLKNLPEPLPLPEPEPEIVPPEIIPEPPKLKKLPKPTVYNYACEGQTLAAKSEDEAKALKAECEEIARKREEVKKKVAAEKLLVEKKRKAEKLKKAQAKKDKAKKDEKEALAKKKRKAELKKKALADKKRKAEALKKKVAEKKAVEKKALAKKKREAAEKKKKALAEKKRKDAARKKKQLADKKKKDKARQQAVQRAAAEKSMKAQMNREGAERAWGQAIGGSGGAAIARMVSNNWREDTQCLGLVTKWLIKASPNGQLLGVRMTRSSGNAVCDREAELAIKQSNPLPISVDWPTAAPEEFEFNFAPQ
ncbi:MAG: cell envelope integrity protein TolA [Arenicellales bacterium]